MVTVAHIVKKLVQEKPFYQEALGKGIINNAALAEELLPVIEKELGKKVKLYAVIMAIRRLAEELSKNFIADIRLDIDTDITIKSDLVEITVKKTERIEEKLKELYSVVEYSKGDFLTITHGLYEITIITNRKKLEKVSSIIGQSNIKKMIRNLCSLSIIIPEESVRTVGLFYLTTRAMAWENIPIVEIVSTLTELTLIINEEDTPRAFKTLKEVISRK
jgi:aspartokinase